MPSKATGTDAAREVAGRSWGSNGQSSWLITDVGSSNGTFIRITKETQLPMGSLMLLGQQLFRIEA